MRRVQRQKSHAALGDVPHDALDGRVAHVGVVVVAEPDQHVGFRERFFAQPLLRIEKIGCRDVDGVLSREDLVRWRR